MLFRSQEGMKSLAVNIIFESTEETLQDDKINEVLNKVLNELKASFKAELRQ